MKKVLVYQNESELSRYSATLDASQVSVNEVVTEWNKLPLNKIKTPQEIKMMFEDIEGFAKEMLPIQSDQRLFGISISREKAFTFLDLNLEPVKELINQINHRDAQEFIQVCRPTKSGTFEIDPDKKQTALDQFRIFAVTPKEQEIAAACDDLLKATEKMIALGVSLDRLRLSKPADLWLNSPNGLPQIRPQFYNEILRHSS